MKHSILAAAISLYLFTNPATASDNTSATFNDAYQAYKTAAQSKSGVDALKYTKQSIALASPALMADPENYYALHYNLANAYILAEDYTGAVEQFEALQEWSESHSGKYSFDTFAVRTELASLKINHKYAPDSRNSLRERYSSFKALLNDLPEVKEHTPAEAAATYYAALSLISNNSSPVRLSKLKALLEEGVAMATAQWAEDDVRRLHLKFLLAKVHYARNDLDEAVEEFSDVSNRIDEALAYTHPWVLKAHVMMVQAYSRMGEDELATQYCRSIGKMTPWDDEQDPEPIYRLNPKYPVSAARRGVEGYVKFQFDIDEQGFVVNPQVIDNSGSKHFIRESLKVLEKWRYAPKFESGEPVLAQNKVVQLDFRLEPMR